ncbi:hypothetical protein G9A89_023088 [Geosiphon pyriformis]|nr:hypothetical protein G9A89_023088 [Geosiphon pyriformis]
MNVQTQQNPILENLKIEALNLQTPQNQNNPNPNINNQQNLPPQPNLDLIAYAPIAKLKKFMGEENNVQSHDSKKHVVATIVINKVTSELAANTAINLPNPSLSNPSTSYLPATATSNISATTNSNPAIQSNPDVIWKPKTENCSAKLEISDVTPEDASINNNLKISLKQTINNNIPLATVTNNKLLAAIFPFEIEEPTETFLFSGATLDMKPITVMYTNTKINGQTIKLILDSNSAGSIITQQLINQLDH